MSDLNIPHWLASPAALAMADTNFAFKLPPHLETINRELVEVAAGQTRRLMVNMGFQHGKSTLCSHYFPAWYLLLFPHTRIILAAHEDTYASTFGSAVKDVIERWGPELGISFRKDRKAKGEWVVVVKDEERGLVQGGMVCRGMRGSIQGRPGDLLIVEDPIKDTEQAMSEPLMDKQWAWYSNVAYARLSKDAPILVVTTRWGRNDLCGRIEQKALVTGEPWKIIKFKAIADENDVLGRQPGEPLWPEMKPLSFLETVRKQSGRWWRVCWQQDDGEGTGTWFKPRDQEGRWVWPAYVDLRAGAWSLRVPTGGRRIVGEEEVTIYITVDWAYSKKKSADYTAMLVAGVTLSGEIMLLDLVHARLGVNELAPTLDNLCYKWKPSCVAVESGHPTLRDECHKYPSIPEPRWLANKSKNKLTRALQAIMMGENYRIYLPDDTMDVPWLEPLTQQLLSFTGQDDDHEDMVDALSYAADLARELRGRPLLSSMGGPLILTAGKEQAV
jgi:predicted phage terminase large subunit-like protein